jgi:ATP-dependent 26S proteasome regulatory subunit
MREDLYQIFMTYVNERPSENNLIMEINKNTMQFLKDSNTTNSDEIKKSGKVYTIATQVDVVQTYDFENDPKQILMEIKNKIP